jgi:hypothetical protein
MLPRILPPSSASGVNHSSPDAMAWAIPRYSREDINRAGKVLVRESKEATPPWSDERWAAWSAAIDVINNWRSSHGYPLNTFQMNLRKSARAVDRNADIAQRTKRLVSIRNEARSISKYEADANAGYRRL